MHTQTQPCPAPAITSPPPPQDHTPHSTPQHKHPQPQPSILVQTNSLVALQHVSLCTDESLNARNVTSNRCNPYGRYAVPARARISAQPNTSLPCPCNHIPPSPSKPHPTLNTATQAPATPALNPHPNNSRVALQHVSLCTDESLHTRNVT